MEALNPQRKEGVEGRKPVWELGLYSEEVHLQPSKYSIHMNVLILK